MRTVIKKSGLDFYREVSPELFYPFLELIIYIPVIANSAATAYFQ
jgi:hypothetical protein